MGIDKHLRTCCRGTELFHTCRSTGLARPRPSVSWGLNHCTGPKTCGTSDPSARGERSAQQQHEGTAGCKHRPAEQHPAHPRPFQCPRAMVVALGHPGQQRKAAPSGRLRLQLPVLWDPVPHPLSQRGREVRVVHPEHSCIG